MRSLKALQRLIQHRRLGIIGRSRRLQYHRRRTHLLEFDQIAPVPGKRRCAPAGRTEQRR